MDLNIGERIKLARKKNKKTQKELGDLLNLNQSTIALIEKGKSNLTVESLILICKEYKVSADWLLFGYESKDKLEINYNRLNAEEKYMVNKLFENAILREKEYIKEGNL